MEDKLKHLPEIGRATKGREKVGIAQRDIIKIDGKRYLYNPDNISSILSRKVKAVYKAIPSPTAILDDILQQDIEDGPRGMTRRQRIDRRKNIKTKNHYNGSQDEMQKISKIPIALLRLKCG